MAVVVRDPLRQLAWYAMSMQGKSRFSSISLLSSCHCSRVGSTPGGQAQVRRKEKEKRTAESIPGSWESLPEGGVEYASWVKLWGMPGAQAVVQAQWQRCR